MPKYWNLHTLVQGILLHIYRLRSGGTSVEQWLFKACELILSTSLEVFGRKVRPIQDDSENPGCILLIECFSWFHLHVSKLTVSIF